MLLNSTFESEIHILSTMVEAISRDDRYARDFTRMQFRRALIEILSSFPVYRTFITPETKNSISEVDRKFISSAIAHARAKDRSLDGPIFDFIEKLLLGGNLDEKEIQFVMKFQQLSGPSMAKGLEDTAFYRFFLLTSLNEVGGSPDKFGVTLAEFHAENVRRARDWNSSMSASSTHDTKRSEDVRARLNVLSELLPSWKENVERWSKLNEKHIHGNFPEKNMEYLFYQTLVGAWPFEAKSAKDEFIQRIKNYLMKAAKEGKVHTR